MKYVYLIQVNYYLRTQDAEDTKSYKYKQSIRFHGQVRSGIVIGLNADTYYYVQAQVFTDAGLGPLGEKYPAETMNPGITVQITSIFCIFRTRFTVYVIIYDIYTL